ncbi:HK97-gp10 family putative phage morphogenesis protein [Murimonas intestini]|uniref:HK97 gp10 family phage protein n=1 Tax=Murimonas intestini TaxID=1337051 RepID=A0AB73SZL3_9FIRM|nr:HK97-gp10 family putative phage morphogenesis protein [Murimonas intestini]MCR1842757.1 hypothetical protein [Murimonas intestini]MCR1867904.1 hypothetical protein [Murimonas intestini]MCR1885256.1 hypothetical protein [Murimonas intestini]
MAKIKASPGLDAMIKKLNDLAANSQEITNRTVYKGAEVVADAIKDALKMLPVQEGENGLPPVGTENAPLTGVSRKQKGDLIDSMGIAPIQEFMKGVTSTKIGWDGYGSVPTRKYPKGVPNSMLMRSVESGSSFRRKHPTVRPAVNAIKGPALAAMEKQCSEDIRKIMK